VENGFGDAESLPRTVVVKPMNHQPMNHRPVSSSADTGQSCFNVNPSTGGPSTIGGYLQWSESHRFEGFAQPHLQQITSINAHQAHSFGDVFLNPCDIICGRERIAFNHVGNKRLRYLVAMYRDSYQSTSSREEKTRIVDNIIHSIHMKGGRFLKFDEATRFWCVLSKDDVHKKVAHALRSAKSKRQNKKPRKKKVCHRQMNFKQIDKTFILLLKKQQNLIQGVFREENPPAPVDFIMDLSIIDELESNLEELVL
jgi:hypothetical protein